MITIIVLLILAGVTVATLTGDNGLLQKATTAKQENEEAKELELIKLAVSSAQVAGEGTLTTDNLNNELKSNFGDNKLVTELSEGWIYKTNNNYKIDKSGNIEQYEILVPDKYKQLEYIESKGNQHIDTGVKLDYNSGVDFSAVCNEGSQGVFFSSGSYYKENVLFIRLEINNNIFSYYNGIQAGVWNYSENAILPMKYNISMRNRQLIVNNRIKYNEVALNSGECDSNCSIMACKGKYYFFKIYNDNELIRNFIPCYCVDSVTDANDNVCQSGTVGMYDIVEGKFYKNLTGAGNFIKGPEL